MISISHPTKQPNLSVVTVGDLQVTFSYSTPIAFQVGTDRQVVRVNDWSNTTGRHLAWCDGGDKVAKARRVSGPDFVDMLELACAPLGGVPTV